jgi:hypothetical protein
MLAFWIGDLDNKKAGILCQALIIRLRKSLEG